MLKFLRKLFGKTELPTNPEGLRRVSMTDNDQIIFDALNGLDFKYCDEQGGTTRLLFVDANTKIVRYKYRLNRSEIVLYYDSKIFSSKLSCVKSTNPVNYDLFEEKYKEVELITANGARKILNLNPRIERN